MTSFTLREPAPANTLLHVRLENRTKLHAFVEVHQDHPNGNMGPTRYRQCTRPESTFRSDLVLAKMVQLRVIVVEGKDCMDPKGRVLADLFSAKKPTEGFGPFNDSATAELTDSNGHFTVAWLR